MEEKRRAGCKEKAEGWLAAVVEREWMLRGGLVLFVWGLIGEERSWSVRLV